MSVTVVEVVKYYWREYYVRVVDGDRILHYGPWNTKTAAEYLVPVLWARFKYEGRLP